MKIHPYTILSLTVLLLVSSVRAEILYQTDFSNSILAGNGLHSSNQDVGYRDVLIFDVDSATHFGTAGGNYLYINRQPGGSMDGASFIVSGIGVVNSAVATPLTRFAFDMNVTDNGAGRITFAAYVGKSFAAVDRALELRFDWGAEGVRLNNILAASFGYNAAVRVELFANNSSEAVTYYSPVGIATLDSGHYSLFVDGELKLENTSIGTGHGAAGNDGGIESFTFSYFGTAAQNYGTIRIDRFEISPVYSLSLDDKTQVFYRTDFSSPTQVDNGLHSSPQDVGYRDALIFDVDSATHFGASGGNYLYINRQPGGGMDGTSFTLFGIGVVNSAVATPLTRFAFDMNVTDNGAGRITFAAYVGKSFAAVDRALELRFDWGAEGVRLNNILAASFGYNAAVRVELFANNSSEAVTYYSPVGIATLDSGHYSLFVDGELKLENTSIGTGHGAAGNDGGIESFTFSYFGTAAQNYGTIRMDNFEILPIYRLTLDESDVEPGEWGFRPEEGEHIGVSPPSFVWHPQAGVARWQLEVLDAITDEEIHRCGGIKFNVYRPSVVFAEGHYQWRYRGWNFNGQPTEWSRWRTFTVDEGAQSFPLPERREILSLVPSGHPRLFLTPDNIEAWRLYVQGDLADDYQSIRLRYEQFAANPPDLTEPEAYTADEINGSPAWREKWWGNRLRAETVMRAAYLSGFVAQIENDPDAAVLGVTILDAVLDWDPEGTTGFAYNSEASYPYAWGLARAYSLLYPYLDEDQQQRAREVLAIRGTRYYEHLHHHQHLWRPYRSHENRIWHFLGEIALVLHGDYQPADDWLWYAMNVFANVYPAWGGSDGGWHEGGAYHASYLSRFLWWAVIMDEALGINAFESAPFFKRAGDYVLYVMPPNKVGGGFGDQAELVHANSISNLVLMERLASLANNPNYRAYADIIRGNISTGSSGISDLPALFFKQYPLPAAADLAGLPSSRIFHDTGLAALNTCLIDANNSVQVLFKSSERYGTSSHGYESNNAFEIWAYGQRMLIKTGFRDTFGSSHHRNWMWSTRSTNNITVDGMGQYPRSMAAQGRIVDSLLSPEVDAVVGEAGSAYFQQPGEASVLDRFTRALIFIKPDIVVVADYLTAPSARNFEYWLHAQKAFELGPDQTFFLNNEGVKMVGQMLLPQDLQWTQTDQYDPNPDETVTLREWHLTASTPLATTDAIFLAVFTFAPADVGLTEPSDAWFWEENGRYSLQFEDSNEDPGKTITLNLPSLLANGAGAEEIFIHISSGEQPPEEYILHLKQAVGSD